MGGAFAKLMGAEVAIPDYTSLQKRAVKFGVVIRVAPRSGPIDVVVDSTGLKVFGEGEWKVRKHDADLVEPLLDQAAEQVNILYGDGAYDQRKVYEALAKRNIHVIVPPRKNAKIKQHGNASADPLPRDECVRQIRREGRKAWKESIGYHRRSLVETAMHRLKANFGDRLKNRTIPNQATEAALRCKLLNAFVTFGMPIAISCST